MDIDKIYAYTDGGAAPTNPGLAAIGVYIEQLNIAIGEPVGITTNNCAEYLAIIRCIGIALEHSVQYLVIYSDSKLAVQQINGNWSVKSDELGVFLNEVNRLKGKLPQFEIHHIHREQNTIADGLIHTVYDRRIT